MTERLRNNRNERTPGGRERFFRKYLNTEHEQGIRWAHGRFLTAFRVCPVSRRRAKRWPLRSFDVCRWVFFLEFKNIYPSLNWLLPVCAPHPLATPKIAFAPKRFLLYTSFAYLTSPPPLPPPEQKKKKVPPSNLSSANFIFAPGYQLPIQMIWRVKIYFFPGMITEGYFF